eukprot:2342572-Pyramimonas_sp.AAC.2
MLFQTFRSSLGASCVDRNSLIRAIYITSPSLARLVTSRDWTCVDTCLTVIGAGAAGHQGGGRAAGQASCRLQHGGECVN